MILSYNELVALVRQGVITAQFENINGSSIDVRLGDSILVEARGSARDAVSLDLSKKECPAFEAIYLPKEGFLISPGRFFLAHTLEKFFLPYDISAKFYLRSSAARAGLQSADAGWCDPGWHDAHLTMALSNRLNQHNLLIKPGMKIGQVVFFRHEEVPHEQSYAVRGRYNRSLGVVTSKGVA